MAAILNSPNGMPTLAQLRISCAKEAFLRNLFLPGDQATECRV